MRNLLIESLTNDLQLKIVNDLSRKLGRNEYAAIESVETEGETTLRVVRYNDISLSDYRPRPSFINTTEESSGGY